MNTIILNILCEGQTEEKFVKDILKPYLNGFGIVVKSRILITSRKKNASGGLISYQHAKKDLELWQKEVGNKNGETHYFTTMFDLYALPNDFPGVDQSKEISDAYSRVVYLEKAFADDMNFSNFIPYIQLHEFEALLFCDIEKLLIEYPKCQKEILKLNEILSSYNGNPELINNSPQSAPSKRIIKAIEGKHLYSYNKPRSGSVVASAIGIDNIISRCEHFRNWIKQIKALIQ